MTDVTPEVRACQCGEDEACRIARERDELLAMLRRFVGVLHVEDEARVLDDAYAWIARFDAQEASDG